MNGLTKFTSERPRHCRTCGCVPCIDGTTCEGDLYPMDFVVVREMREALHFPRLLKAVDEIMGHPRYRYSQTPRSPKPRSRRSSP